MTDDERKIVSGWIKQAQEGDEKAFTELYKKYSKLIYYVIIKIIKDRDAADDIHSITFIKAYTRINSYVEDISFSMWLKTIAINTAIDYIRRRKWEQYSYKLDDDENNFELSSSKEYSPEEKQIAEETQEMINKAVKKLRPSHRRIFELRVLQELTYEEITKITGISEDKLRSIVTKARQRIKKLIS